MKGVIEFDDGRVVELAESDSVDIPAHTRRRVVFTEPDEITLWLAVFYR